MTFDWRFLQQVMEGMGFSQKFLKWVMECVTTVNYSILINGEPTPPFDATRGLRQGDPMSPFLFAIAMEYRSRLLDELKEDRQFKFHPKCSKMNITHLSFADDLLLFTRGDSVSVSKINLKFQQFSTASGLQPNMAKSTVYYGGVKEQEIEIIQNILGYTKGKLPFNYLGVPLASKKLKIVDWQPLIGKIVARISSWTAKKLSYAGRLQLIKSVLFIWSTGILGTTIHPTSKSYPSNRSLC